MRNFLKQYAALLMAAVLVICCPLFLGAGSGEENLSFFSQQADAGAAENPFDGSTSMRVYWEAMEIIEETPINALSDRQRVQLAELGISEEQLPEFLENLEAFQKTHPDMEESGETAVLPKWNLLILGCACLLLFVLLTAGIFLFIRFSRRERKSR